jgi:hypothetical protein
MRKPALMLSFLAALALAACGSSPSKPEAATAAKPSTTEAQAKAEKDAKLAAAKDKRANCEKHTPIGSNRPVWRCFSAEEKKARDEENAREMRKATAPMAGGTGP